MFLLKYFSSNIKLRHFVNYEIFKGKKETFSKLSVIFLSFDYILTQNTFKPPGKLTKRFSESPGHHSRLREQFKSLFHDIDSPV